jgi:hypothetical protein
MTSKYPKLALAGTVASALFGALMFFVKEFPDLQEKYIYRSETWSGNWSSNAEYDISAITNENIGSESGNIAIRLVSQAGKGTVHGQIITEGLCEFQPMTWMFYLDSNSHNFFSAGNSRDFVLSYLRMGKKETIGTLRFTIDGGGDLTEVLVVEKLELMPGVVFPDKFGVGKDLPAFDQDEKLLNDKCGEIHSNFIKAMTDSINKKAVAKES